MKRLLGLSVSLILVISLTISVFAAGAVPKPVMQSTASVVRVLAEYSDGYSTGSGFVIKSNRQETLIATNYHVVEDNPYSISVWIGDDETVSATVLAYTSQKDMCILALAYPVSLKALTFSADSAKQGEAVYAVGFPAAADILSDKEAHTGDETTITDGIISAVRNVTVSPYGSSVSILQINAAINSGNSGGPLFNAKGEVVGINTYGINDSQGIFGAIDVCELKSFLADNSIAISSNAWARMYLILISCIVAVIVMAIIVRVLVKKKKHTVTPQSESAPISLRFYMENHPNGIGVCNAVSLLLPVALKLRDLHQGGNVHLQISPDTIFVGSSGGELLGATNLESNRYTNGYAAPEIYRGNCAGVFSDIYSLCAVLFFVVSGSQPKNSLSRSEDNNSEDDSLRSIDESFAEIIRKGMAIDAEKRFCSMQELITMISPYNKSSYNANSFSVISNKDVVIKESAPKKNKFHKKASIIIAIITIVVLFVAYGGCYLCARICAVNNHFEAANRLLFLPQVTKLHDPNLPYYIEAGKCLAERNYQDSADIFKEMLDYLNAAELAQEADYRRSLQYADSNYFDAAVRILEDLSKKGYKDSATKLLEIQYRHGVYLLYENEDYKAASDLFLELAEKGYADAQRMEYEAQYLWAFDLIGKEQYVFAYKKLNNIKDYSDVKSTLDNLTELMYLEGKSLYYDGDYAKARELLYCIWEYKDSKNYLPLIDARISKKLPQQSVPALKEIFYFEDTAELLLSNQSLAKVFLSGTWRGDGYYFKLEENSGQIFYNLPWFDYGDYYKFVDGYLLLYPKNNESQTKKLFQFEALSPDCIEVYCYQNNKSYTLYREQ